MYFNKLIELSSGKEFDFTLLSEYNNFCIINLGSYEKSIGEDFLFALKGRANTTSESIYVYCEPDTTTAIELVKYFKYWPKTILELDVNRPFIIGIYTKDLLSKDPFCNAQIAYIDDYLEEKSLNFEELTPEEYAVQEAFNRIFFSMNSKVKLKVNVNLFLELIKLIIKFI